MTAEILESAEELSFVQRLMRQMKENRLEAMVVTILLYSTGILEKAYIAGAGVC
jgi:hypothetical protein